ncbi:hypothetical protein ACFRMN_11335 [Streptomyces sp. NPDC056835]|uniref:hypothetical protein n=1 Tax=Streptomyces sp. NPDC056835 TaxID=3345956 RepID=UPI0036AC4DDE
MLSSRGDDPRTPEQPDRPGPPGAEHVVCARCGAKDEGPPVTWSCSVEHGSRQYFCGDCSRVHIRAIEGRLDSDRW